MASFGLDVIAALLTSSAYTTAFYPIHRVKVLIQTQEGHPDVKSGRVQRFHFTSSFHRIVREAGFVSLWRGCLPYMLRHVPSTTLSFAFKDGIQRALPAYDPATQPTQYALAQVGAGGAAGVAALAVVYPLDLTTIRMATHLGPKDPGMLATMERAGGMAALYRGFWVSALAIGGYKALYFGLYDISKTFLLAGGPASAGAAAGHTRAPPPSDGPLKTFLRSWAVASGVVYVASTVTYPLDVVRKRWVLDCGLPPGERQYRSIRHCISSIVRHEGMRGLYRFYGYDMVLRFGGGILLVMYDDVRTRLGSVVDR